MARELFGGGYNFTLVLYVNATLHVHADQIVKMTLKKISILLDKLGVCPCLPARVPAAAGVGNTMRAFDPLSRPRT